MKCFKLMLYIIALVLFAAHEAACAKENERVMVYSGSRDNWVVSTVNDSEVQPAQLVRMYDNYTPNRPPNNNGRTELTSVLATNGDEYADDLVLENYQDGIIDSAGFSVVNRSASIPIPSFRVRFRWLNADTSEFLGGFTLNLSFGNEPILPGERLRVRGTDGTLLGFNIPVAPRMKYTQQWLEVGGGASLDDLGMLYGGPNTNGSSSRFVENLTTGQLVDLGGADKNLGFYVSTFVIPAPGSAVFAVAFAGVVVRRRR